MMGALVEDIAYLLEKMEIMCKERFAEKTFYIGMIEKVEVVLCHSGVGKVNAAMTTQLLIDHFNVNSVILTGTAGLLKTTLKTGDIVVSKDTLEHDVDYTPLGNELGEIHRMQDSIYEANPLLIKIALQAGKQLKGIKVVKGRIVTGAQFIENEEDKTFLRETFQGSVVETEGAAVGQVCHFNKVPFVIIRAISNEADETAGSDFEEQLEGVAIHAQLLVLRMLKGIYVLRTKKLSIK